MSITITSSFLNLIQEHCAKAVETNILEDYTSKEEDIIWPGLISMIISG